MRIFSVPWNRITYGVTATIDVADSLPAVDTVDVVLVFPL